MSFSTPPVTYRQLHVIYLTNTVIKCQVKNMVFQEQNGPLQYGTTSPKPVCYQSFWQTKTVTQLPANFARQKLLKLVKFRSVFKISINIFQDTVHIQVQLFQAIPKIDQHLSKLLLRVQWRHLVTQWQLSRGILALPRTTETKPVCHRAHEVRRRPPFPHSSGP